MSSITLEEHFTSKAAVKQFGSPASEYGPNLGAKLCDLSNQRINDMDAGDVAMQVLSHTPFQASPSPDLCSAANDELREAIRARPTRLAGFASLPMAHPKEAVSELVRAVNELGFVGALVDTHSEGVWYDGPEYDQVWEAAQNLDVPIYLHPCYASEEMLRVNYKGNYGDDVAHALGAWVFGWHVETGLHFLRLFAAGVFDRWPRLKILLGHMGETIPYMLKRQEGATGRWTHLQRPLREVWRANVWVTTSGMFDTAPLRCLLQASPLDHVLLSIDYPFSDTKQGSSFLQDIENEGLLMGKDLEAFRSGNAAKLLRIKP